MSDRTVEDLKKHVDIVEYVGSLIELKKKGANYMACCPFHGEDTPSLSISTTKQYFKCFGCGESGDIIDFEEKYNKVSKAEAIKKIEAFSGINTQHHKPQNYRQEKTPQKTPQEIQDKLDSISKALFNNASKLTPFKMTPLEINGKIIIDTIIHEVFVKLFEKKSFQMTEKQYKKIIYITRNILTYDSFYNCPAIIIRDHNDKVVDICKYRPNKPASFDNWSNPKYMYIKEEEKLKNRGSDFLFPFSKEMDQIIDKHNFFFIGEGLKNALVSLLHGIPFISLESTSNEIKENLLVYIKQKAKTKTIIGGFDGDGGTLRELAEAKETGYLKKGIGAYEKAQKSIGMAFPNLFSFTSDIDMADYLSNQNDLINFESKFESLFLTGVVKNKPKEETQTTEFNRKYKKFIKSS